MLIAVALLLAAGEVFLRAFPPEDFRRYLGEDSPLSGPYEPDPRFGVRYRSWEAFRDDYARQIEPYLPYFNGSTEPKSWAMFGNSFVQAAGMLADTARVRLPQRMIFNLGKNEPLYVRFAQIPLLLERGLRPERIFVALLPVDLITLGQHPLDALHVTTRGALTYRPRDPGGFVGWAIAHSRLALTAWVRSRQHYPDPSFRPADLTHTIDPSILRDLERLFRGLRQSTEAYGIPITVVLIPNYEQIAKGAPRGLQETLTPLLRAMGYDVCDVSAPFVAHPDKASLFIPDKHFSPAGNQVLFDALVAHLRSNGADPATLDARGAQP